MGTILLVTSGKGGTGKSTVAVNLGATLALKGAKVLLVDLNMGLRNLDIYMGLENSVLFDMGDCFSGVCKWEKAIVCDDRCGDLYLLPAPQFRTGDEITATHYAKMLEFFKKSFDYVIVDTAVALNGPIEGAAAAADAALVVVTPDYTAVRNCDTMIKRLESLGVEKISYVLNKVDLSIMKQHVVPSVADIDQSLQIPSAGIIPMDENIHNGNNSGTPTILAASSYVANNFAEIALRLF